MIKQINSNNILVTKFVAQKSWELNNVYNEDLFLVTTTSSADWENIAVNWELEGEYWNGFSDVSGSDLPLALEFIDYSVYPPVLNRNCNIALDPQPEDRAIIEEGVSGSGTFYPSSEPTNLYTSTYKRSVYNQIQKSFYNNYKNPFEILGMETIDFPLSQTNRIISDQFLVFSIPRIIFGDKISPSSIYLYDYSYDDNVIVSDDGFGNLLAGPNLFSKVQEVRSFGNIINEGTASNLCPTSIIGSTWNQLILITWNSLTSSNWIDMHP